MPKDKEGAGQGVTTQGEEVMHQKRKVFGIFFQNKINGKINALVLQLFD